MKLFRLNMSYSSFLLLTIVLFNFGFLPNSFGRYILVEVGQKEAAINESGSGTIERIVVLN